MSTNWVEITHSQSHGLIEISGPDYKTFMQNLVTCDITQVNEHSASAAALCDPKGRILANFVIFEYEQALYLIFPTAMLALFQKNIRKYALFSKVTIKNVSNDWAIYGNANSTSKSFDIDTREIINISHPAGNLMLSKQPEKLVEYCQQNNVNITSENGWQLACILAGFAAILPETSGLFTPHMINLQKFNGVSFNKGCYIGQEIIARTEHLGKLKRHLHHIRFDSESQLEAGTAIETKDKDKVGTLVNSAKNQTNCQGLAVIEDRAIKNPTLYLADKPITFH